MTVSSQPNGKKERDMRQDRKLTLEEKAERILHTTLPCGCPATDSGLDGYTVEGGHTCDGSVLNAQRQERRQERRERGAESVRRHAAPRNGEQGFQLMR